MDEFFEMFKHKPIQAYDSAILYCAACNAPTTSKFLCKSCAMENVCQEEEEEEVPVFIPHKRPPRWKLQIFHHTTKHKQKKLGSAKRAQVWVTYAQLFINKYKGTPWFDRVNPPDRVYTVILCWCCGMRELTAQGYGRFPGFEAGHVVAQSKTHDDSIDNLRPICKDCNMKMNTMHMAKYAKYMEYTRSEIVQECAFF